MGRSVAETQAAVSSREFVEWQVYEQLEGPGEPERSDLRIALLDWHMHRLLLGDRKSGRLRLTDLALRFRRPGNPAETLTYEDKRAAWLKAAGVK
jgi:hypothetical protein